jgi:hypothetical protein
VSDIQPDDNAIINKFRPEARPFYFQLKSAHSAYDEAAKRLTAVENELGKAQAETKQLETAFESASRDAAQASADLARPEALAALKKQHEAARIERDSAISTLKKSETLAGLHGVDPNEAVPVPAENSAGSDHAPAGKWAYYLDLRKKEKQQTVPIGTARKFWAENKEALQKHAASQRQK